MRNKKEILALVNTAKERIYASCEKLVANKSIDFNEPVDTVCDRIGEIIQSVCNVVSGESYYIEGADLPKFLKSWSSVEDNDKVLCIDLKVRTKLNSEILYKDEERIYCNEDFIKNIYTLIAKSVIEIFYLELALENVKEINNHLGKIVAEEGIDLPFDIDFVLADKPIVAISDEEVVLGVSPANAIEISSQAIFLEGDSYLDYCASIAKTKFLDALLAVQTPVQLLKANIELINDVTGLKTKKRADSILRTIYHKQAKYLTTAKKGMGYISEEVEIDGEKVNIFSLVEKEDGKLEVVLTPFNIKTLENVTFDVIELLNKGVSEEAEAKAEADTEADA